jgi:hypothetical protein
MESAEIVEEWVEEEKIPVKRDVPAPKKTDTQASPSSKPQESAPTD